MILTILQARASSTRLPGKVLLPILQMPMIIRQIERVQRAHRIGHLVVATSDQVSDDPIASLCQEAGIACSRGSLDDVLDRFYQAARPHQPSDIVRLTGDCPLCDPAIIDEVIDCHVKGDYDYTSNTLHPTFPDGLDVEVVRFQAIESAWQEARLPSEREHVTPFVYKRPDRFRLGSYQHSSDLSRLRWTVDNPEDYEFVCRVYETLYPTNSQFTMQDVLRLLAREPALGQLNTHLRRNEGYEKSLSGDHAPLGRDKRG